MVSLSPTTLAGVRLHPSYGHHFQTKKIKMRILCAYLSFSSPPTFLSAVHCHLLFPRLTSLHLRDLRTKAASVGGSTADFPEHLVGDGAAKWGKQRSVAGVNQEELLDPENLADPDSFFFEINGVQIHHKTCHHEAEEEVKKEAFRGRRDGAVGIGLPIILLHGFGASVFSWDRVMKPLARMTRSKVLAFDRPAFGLTSRIGYLENKDSGGREDKSLNPYSMAFSVLATLSFIDMFGAGKAILMGHSAGCLVAVNTYFEFPERIAALILVAPAIFAPLFVKKDANYGALGKKKMGEEGNLDSGAGEAPFAGIWCSFSRLLGAIAGGFLKMLNKMTNMVSSLFAKAVAAILRSAFGIMLVRIVMDKFGILAIRSAWYDSSQVTDDVIQGYTKPLKAKGWDRALLEYTLLNLSNPPLSKRLAEITCPVLIVTGETDRIVPSWNAQRLAQAIPGSTFEVINKCGHLPHEEKAEEFLAVIERFLCKTFGIKEDLEGQFTEVVT